MRTTFRLNDQLLQELKRRAAESGKSMNALVEEALRLAFTAQDASASREPVNLLSDGAGGLQPGIDLSDNAAVREAMER